MLLFLWSFKRASTCATGCCSEVGTVHYARYSSLLTELQSVGTLELLRRGPGIHASGKRSRAGERAERALHCAVGVLPAVVTRVLTIDARDACGTHRTTAANFRHPWTLSFAAFARAQLGSVLLWSWSLQGDYKKRSGS